MPDAPSDRARPDFDYSALSRRPDLEADNLFAVDAADRLILDEAAGPLGTAGAGEVVVIGDHYGALTLGAAATFGLTGIRTHQDLLVGELALANNAATTGLADRFESLPLGPQLVANARVVLLQLPRSLGALDEIAGMVAAHAHPDVVIFAGGRLKHMTLTQNSVLGRYFETVSAGLSRQKSRVLAAYDVRADAEVTEWPAEDRHDDLDLVVAAHGATFAGTKIDIGTRALLEVLPKAAPDARTIVDLGCGSGILAAVVARARPDARVIASDQSASAVASATATARLNGLADRIEIVHEDALATQPDASADLILLNPPFHVDAAVEPGVALALFSAASRVLRPGGELWTVYNSHLKHRPMLEDLVGSTREVQRTRKFTVTASTKS